MSATRTSAVANDHPDRDRARGRKLRYREQGHEHDDRHGRGPGEPPRELHAGTSSECAELVAHRDERVHGVVPHRRLRLMVAEPSPFEEIGEPADGLGARVEGEEGTLDVLERRLGGVPRNPGCGEGGLHPGVGGDDRAAQVGIGPQVVERLVESRSERFGGLGPRPRLAARAHHGDGHARRDREEETEDDRELVPAELWGTRSGVVVVLRLVLPRPQEVGHGLAGLMEVQMAWEVQVPDDQQLETEDEGVEDEHAEHALPVAPLLRALPADEGGRKEPGDEQRHDRG